MRGCVWDGGWNDKDIGIDKYLYFRTNVPLSDGLYGVDGCCVGEVLEMSDGVIREII